MQKTLLSTTLAAVLIAGCASGSASRPVPPSSVSAVVDRPGASPGDVIAFSPLVSLSLDRTRTETSLQPPGIDATTGVRISRLTYRSSINGQLVDASALIAVPATDAPLKGVVLYLRGSDIPRSAAPTNPQAIPITQASVFGGNGYAVVMPDYLGFGASPPPQAFLLTQENVADFRAALEAARNVLGLQAEAPLFVMGFSQGGQLSAAFVRDVEARPLEGFGLRGTVAVAGPHELVESLRRRLRPPLSSDPTAIGYVAWGAYTYAWRTGRPMEDIFTPAYAPRVAQWFGGDMEIPEILAEFPATANALFQPDFLRAVEGNDSSFWFIGCCARTRPSILCRIRLFGWC